MQYNKELTYRGYYKFYQFLACMGIFTLIIALIIIIQLLTNGV